MALSAQALFLAGSPTGFGADNTRTNVLLFLVDDMGWTDLSCFGSAVYETSAIDRLATQGMRFTNAYSACTVCSPTRASILTGKYPARLHLTDWIPGHPNPKGKLKPPAFNQELPHEEITLAEMLKPHGYTSASIGKWHLGDEPYYPETQGFDLNVGGTKKGQPPSYFSPYQIPTLQDGPEGENLTDRMAAEAIHFIEQNRDRTFFVYLPFFAVHTPLQAKKEYIEKYQAKIQPGMAQHDPVYASMVQNVDESVGRVLARLDELGMAERTLVIFTSDNGGLIPKTSNLPLRAGKGSAYEGGVRVPMIVRGKGWVRPGSVCDTPVMSIDLFPTILDILQIPQDAEHPVDGVSLAPLLQESGTFHREALYWHYPHYHPGGAHPYGAVRRGDDRLIEFYEDGALELYNLKEDIGEKRNLVKENPEKTRELHRMLHAWLSETKAQMPTPNPDYIPEVGRDSNG